MKVGMVRPVPILLLLAAALLGGGLLLLLRDDIRLRSAAAIPVHGHRRPADFSLPEFPGAREFDSIEAGPGRGSASYRLRRGSSAEVVGFYRKELGKAGWKFTRQLRVRQPAAAPNTPGLAGLSARWEHRENRRRLSLQAFDFPGMENRVQVLLIWSPPMEGG